MKIHIDGGLFTTSGYSVSLRGFVEELMKHDDVQLTLRDIPIQGDHVLPDIIPKFKKYLINQPPKDADIVLMWGVPDLRKLYKTNPIPERSLKQHMVSWECDEIPKIWKEILDSDVDSIITPSNYSANSLNGLMEKTFILPHGFNPEVFYKKDIKEDGVFRVLYTGTWIRRKAPMETIIGLALGLVNTNSEIMLKLNYEKNNISQIMTSIQSQLMRISLPKGVVFPKIRIFNGTYTQDQMNDLYNVADVMVLTSRGEAWGMPLMNGMVTATPIITIDEGGQLDFIPHDYPYLVKTNGVDFAEGNGYYASQFGLKWLNPDFIDLQDKIRDIYNLSPEEREEVGKKLQKHIQEFTWKKIVDNYLNYFNNS